MKNFIKTSLKLKSSTYIRGVRESLSKKSVIAAKMNKPDKFRFFFEAEFSGKKPDIKDVLVNNDGVLFLTMNISEDKYTLFTYHFLDQKPIIKNQIHILNKPKNKQK